jgi:non-specific serine/threonine protein kinase/NIMA (never in mitosis gene a)-related kinase
MSPEIFQNKPYSYKSDVWALGCVLYEMTTLNHAFDANSINGLAGKIVKGRYPPIHHKYSRYLRELIGQMLQINPTQRPDLDQILRKPFIKKHTINFFMDMNARPQASIGEGTMIVRQASGGGFSGNDVNMLGLRKQLQQLDMTGALSKALEPKEPIKDVVSAQKVVKEQVGALKREEEHKRLVEAALEKMRQERANRVKHRSQHGNARVPDSGPYGNRGRDRLHNRKNKNEEPHKPAALRNRGPSQAELRGVPSNEALRKEQRDRYSVGSKQSAPEPVSARRRSFGEDQDRLKERERRVAEEKKRIQVQEQASRDRADEKRREDVRIEARAREEARIEAEKRNREDMIAKQKMDLLKAQADSAARRDKQREIERIRQQDEIEQLKRDKIELDRRTNEREKLREQRKLEEQAKLNEVRKEKMDLVQEKIDSMNDQIKNIPNPRIFRSAPEEKDSINLNARERVIFRKQEKLAKEEENRMDELRKAENDNRRIRENAQFKNRAQYRSGDLPPDESESKYEFDAGARKSTKNRQENMNVNELSDRLFEATKGLGKPNRFESDSEPPTDRESGRSRDTSVDNANIGKRIENELFSSDSSGGEDDESVNWDAESNNGAEEDEIMNRREEELQAELQMATLRCDELKRTLIETKSFIDPKVASKKPQSSMANKKPQGGPVPSYDNLDEVSSDDEDEFEEYEDSNDYDDEPVVVSKSSNSDKRNEAKEDPNTTPRKQKSLNIAVKESPYYNLQDPPTPTGRLSDRIERLRQRCIEALGAEAFFDAYRFLKDYDVSFVYLNIII